MQILQQTGMSQVFHSSYKYLVMNICFQKIYDGKNSSAQEICILSTASYSQGKMWTEYGPMRKKISLGEIKLSVFSILQIKT